MDAWHYKPLSGQRLRRLVRLIVPHLSADSPGRSFLGHLTGDELAELLSVITGRPVKWITANFSAGGAARALGEFSRANDDLAALYRDWRRLRNVN